MSEHVGYVVQIQELKPHSNADRLQIAVIFGASVIVGLDVKVGDLGVYFPIDLQLSEEYCTQNNLVRKKDENGNNIGGYLEPDKRNIRAMTLRGEKSEGLFMPLESLAYTGESRFAVGDTIEILNGHEICRKYIPKIQNPQGHVSDGNHTRKHHVPISPLFAEHADTEQLAYNMAAFKPGDQIEITLKMHGTSSRIGRMPVLQKYKKTFLDFLFRKEGKPIYNWDYISGTRRCILSSFDGGFYGSNSFRKQYEDFFRGKLNKGEEVFGEIVGFTDNGVPIMPTVSNSKVSDKEFTRQYGETTTFSYGCAPEGEVIKYGEDEYGVFSLPVKTPQSALYVYRMTITNEDGIVVEYTPDFMRYRCEQMGANFVPVLWKGFIPEDCGGFSSAGEYVKHIAEQYYDGSDPIGKTHIREGVVIRIVNRPQFCAYKHKNFNFKIIEGIAKDLAVAPDMEEAQDLVEEES